MSPGRQARRLARRHTSGALATQSRKLPGYPYASALPCCTDAQGRIVVLISSLAEHTQNADADPRASFLVASFGPGLPEQARLSQPPKPLGVISDWITSADFPKKALNQGSSGLVQFRLDIDETGKVSGCRILYRTNPDDFADLSCKLLTQRAKFSPALDSAGKAVRSFYVSKIRWQSAW